MRFLILASISISCFGQLTVYPILDCIDPPARSTLTTTLSAAAAAGATTLQITASAGNNVKIVINPGTATEETRLASFANGSYTVYAPDGGPPVLTGAATPSPLQYAHSLNEPVQIVTAASQAYFGYLSTRTSPANIQYGATNFFAPPPAVRLQPTFFDPGIHHSVFSVPFDAGVGLTWNLLNVPAFAFDDPSIYCGSAPTAIGETLFVSPGSSYFGVKFASFGNAGAPMQISSVSVSTDAVLATVSNLSEKNGVVSGNLYIDPSSQGPDSFTISASGPDGSHASAAVSLLPVNACSPAVTLNPSVLPQGSAGSPYGPVTLSASGGTAPYTFSIQGALPSGLSLINGVLSGTPLQAGTFPLSIWTSTATGCQTGSDQSLLIGGAICAANVTGQIGVTLGGFRQNLATGRWSQTVTIRNLSAANINGPVALALDNLSANASLYNASGNTQCAAPLGRPYILVNVGADSVLTPNETASVTLDFTNANPQQSITYQARILAGGTQR